MAVREVLVDIAWGTVAGFIGIFIGGVAILFIILVTGGPP